MGDPGVSVRPISSVSEVREAVAILDRIWKGKRVLGHELLRAMATHGSLVLGAYRGTDMVGTQMAFLGLRDGELFLHSHVTGVAPEAQHAGVGLALKRAQRDWCLERGIDTVTWTFDPMVARNAYFNLHKLGAVAPAFHRDFYGPMEDVLNAGERSDRLEVRWDLRAPRVVDALAGRPAPIATTGRVALGDEGGRPVTADPAEDEIEAEPLEPVLVRVPADYAAMRERDPDLARRWRDAVADALEREIGRGREAVGFLRDGAYVLERA